METLILLHANTSYAEQAKSHSNNSMYGVTQ